MMPPTKVKSINQLIKKPKLSGINIHITAICPYFEVHEIIAEEKAVNRLEGIRDSFKWYESHSKFREKFPKAHLSVKTGVYNPMMF